MVFIRRPPPILHSINIKGVRECAQNDLLLDTANWDYTVQIYFRYGRIVYMESALGQGRFTE